MSLLGTISIRYSNMSVTEKKIADVILAAPQRVVDYTVTDLASAAQVSRGSVANFATSMGFTGYNQMKLDIAKHPDEKSCPKMTCTQSQTSQIFQKVMDTTFDALRYTLDTMSNHMRLAAEELVKADRILIHAAAPSAYVAEDICYCFMRIGLMAGFSSEPIVATLHASNMTKNSALIVVSEGGRTTTGLEVARVAKNKGAKIISFTSTYDSPLYRISDIPLVAVGKNLSEHMDACIARILYMLIAECICSYITSQIGDEAYIKLGQELAVIEKFRESK